MAINNTTPTVPEANITRPDESVSSSNGGMNIALILTVVLSIACVIWAAIAVPHWNFNGDQTRPENMRQNANLPDPNQMAPGTTGANIKTVGNEHDMGNKSFVDGQQVQGDTITRGPGSLPAQPEKTSKLSGSDMMGEDLKTVPTNSNPNQ